MFYSTQGRKIIQGVTHWSPSYSVSTTKVTSIMSNEKYRGSASMCFHYVRDNILSPTQTHLESHHSDAQQGNDSPCCNLERPGFYSDDINMILGFLQMCRRENPNQDWTLHTYIYNFIYIKNYICAFYIYTHTHIHTGPSANNTAVLLHENLLLQNNNCVIL